MNVFTSVGIIIFSALIIMLMQLVPGIFLLLNHSLAGRFSRRRASDTSLFFILGVETISILIFFILHLILCAFPWTNFIIKSDIFAWIVAGVFLALSFCFFLNYFRKGSGTRLFLSRSLVQKFTARIDTTKTRSDAFLLGVVSVLPELLFTLPVYFIATVSIIYIFPVPTPRALSILFFTLVSILPLLTIHFLCDNHLNLADFLRIRFNNKSFFRFFVTFAFFLIAILMILRTTS